MLAWLLRRFAAWALRRYPLAPGETSRTPAQFGAYVITDYMTGEPYITRVLFPRIFGVRFMLHHIHRADNDRALHNHPWEWMRSLILCGSYTEERLDGTRRVRLWNKLSGSSLHRITELHGEVWTLFVAGPRTKDWGFLVGKRIVPWRKYMAQKRTELR